MSNEFPNSMSRSVERKRNHRKAVDLHIDPGRGRSLRYGKGLLCTGASRDDTSGPRKRVAELTGASDSDVMFTVRCFHSDEPNRNERRMIGEHAVCIWVLHKCYMDQPIYKLGGKHMSVDAETKRLLIRWQALSQSDALQRTKSMALTLWIVGLVVVVFVVVAIAKGLSPILVACGAAVAGWVIAETNALRTRIAQWNTFQNYLDWKRIEQDLNDAT